jgi:formiminoglutamase
VASITPGRCDLAPQAIRAALARFSTWDFDTSCDIRDLRASDLGDLPVADKRPEDVTVPAFADYVAAVLLGGDNSVTRPGVHSLGLPLNRCGLLTLDAHLDVRSLDGGLTNGNPVRGLLADGLPGDHIIQIGIQSFANSPEYATVAREAGIRTVTPFTIGHMDIDSMLVRALSELSDDADAIYVDLDLDVLDRMCSPGTPGSRPGGLTPAEVRRAVFLCGMHSKVRTLDIVELDPTKDIADTTALAAAACLLSFASGVIWRLQHA